MSNTSTYVSFSAIDYKGSITSLSSYALPITPVRFVPALDDTYDTRVLWDFGDGTTSRSFSASKYYDTPGAYQVSLIIYDCNNNAQISYVSKRITILDYIPFTLSVELSGSLSADNAPIKNGAIEGPIYVNYSYPPYQETTSVFFTVSGSQSDNIYKIKDNKFYHLDNFYSMYKKTYNYAISSFQYRDIDQIVPEVELQYAKLSSNQIVRCEPTDFGSIYIGCSGRSETFFKDDVIDDQVYINWFFDKSKYYRDGLKIKYGNNLRVTLSANVIENDNVDRLSITSNGVDGEGYSIESFNIAPIKYFNSKIPFVVKIKDLNNFSVKNFDPIPLSALTITLSAMHTVSPIASGSLLLDEYGNEINANGTLSAVDSIYYTISSLNDTLSAQDHGGAFRGYIVFDGLSAVDLIQNVFINVSGTFTNNLSTVYSLSGVSNYFNVYDSNYFDIYKKNENFDAPQTLRDITFQESIAENNKLYDDFFAAALGTKESAHDTIGLKLYEKIANFVQNTQDLDTCEQEYIDSLGELVGFVDDNEERYQYPNKVKRIMNLASIDKSKLLGEINKFKENFDIKGRSDKLKFGVNLGDDINPQTYVVNVSSGGLVALEKFSNEYTYLNPYQPLSALSATSSYPLSSYSSDWGWPLVLPIAFDFSKIDKYYTFFEYTSAYEGTIQGSVVDFGNTKTTILSTNSNYNLFGGNGIFENMFLDTLYQSLSLV